jgi:putative DNA primase/helicase
MNDQQGFHGPPPDADTVKDEAPLNLSALDLTGLPASNLDWALAYARAGMRVFPLSANKIPLTPHGYKDATTDPEVIKGYWSKRQAHAEIGWALPETIVAIDLDMSGSSWGIVHFEEIAGLSADSVETPIAVTTTGGRHLVYERNGRAIKNWVRFLPGKDMDTRTIGGYIVLPGPNNGRSWLKPLTIPLAPVPDWVPEAKPESAPAEGRPFAGESDYGRRMMDWALRSIAEATNGYQEKTLNKVCMTLGGLIGGGVLDYQPTLAALTKAALEMPTFDDDRPWRGLSKKVLKTVNDGMKRPLDPPEEIKRRLNEANEAAAREFGVEPEAPEAEPTEGEQPSGQEPNEQPKPEPEETKPEPPKGAKADKPRPGTPTRKQIVFGPGLIREAAIATEAELKRCSQQLFQRGGKIVTLTMIKGKSYHGIDTINPGIAELNVDDLLGHIDQVVQIKRLDRKGATKPIPPRELVTQVLRMTGALTLPVLRGMVHIPLVLPSGRVIETPGYDEATGILYDPLGVEFPRIPEAPTRDDARRAIEVMWKPFEQYKFAHPGVGRASTLALLITCCVRAALGVVPMWGISSPQRGSGKGKLLSTVSTISMGELPIIITQGADVEEEEKRLTAAIRSGSQLIDIDNSDRPIKGAFIESLTTAEILGLRPFRRNDELIKVPNNTLLVYNGKQLEITSDLVRRSLLIDIDPGVEFPWETAFPFDPVVQARRDRPEIVVAVCTLLKAFTRVPLADRPKLSAFGNFEPWSDFARAALVWAGEDDPVTSQKMIVASDEDRMGMAEVFEAWTEATTDPVTAGELMGLALKKQAIGNAGTAGTTGETKDGEPKMVYVYPRLRAALLEIAGDEKGFITSKKLAGWLRMHKKVPVGGQMIIMTKDAGAMLIHGSWLGKHP